MGGIFALPFLPRALPWTTALISAARRQIGVTTSYNAAYVGLDYPGGDVPRETGVCIDVVVRAYRDAFGFDFQKSIHEDMRVNFSRYPTIWGLPGPDRNIDHRRVPNLETFLTRKGAEQPNLDWQPGDIMTCRLPGNLPHTGIVSDRRSRWGDWYVIHNIGRGTEESALLGDYADERRFTFAA